MQVFFGKAHLGIRHLEDGDEQLLPRVELIEDQPLGDVCARGDRVGVAASETVFGELRKRNLRISRLVRSRSRRRIGGSFAFAGARFFAGSIGQSGPSAPGTRLPSSWTESIAIDSNYPMD
jgi:hypothetical protein